MVLAIRCGVSVAIALVMLSGCSGNGGSQAPPSSATVTALVTGIAPLDRFLALISSRDEAGLVATVGFERQTCSDDALTATSGLCEAIPFDGDALAPQTTVPVFVYTGPDCERRYVSDVNRAAGWIDDYFSRYSNLRVYGVGQGGIGKFDDGYRNVIMGEDDAGEALASVWYLQLDGKLISVVEDCQHLSVGEFVERTNVLAQPLVTPTSH
jgi:hypothetical protein